MLAFGVFLAISLFNRPSTTVIVGHVYSGLDDHAGAFGPVSGAVISNDWDTTTATTGGDGYFRLALTKKIAGDEFVVLTVRSGSIVFRQRSVGYQHMNLELVLPSRPN